MKRYGRLLLALLLAGCGGDSDAEAGDLRARLLAILQDRRVVEPQVYGLIGHKACEHIRGEGEVIDRVRCGRLPEPGSAGFRKLSDLATEIRAELAGDSQDALHAAGVLAFVWHQDSEASVAAAIEHLIRARRLAPDDPAVVNDLAAAHLVAAEVRQDPDDLIRALDLLEQAADRGELTPALQFNRALAMEKLYLVSQARDAWRAYADMVDEQAWVREAEAHARKLARLSVDPGEAWLARARAAIEDRSRPAIDELVRESPQEAREMVLGRLLGEWAEAELKGAEAEAAEAHWGARAMGSALDSFTGEQSALEAVAGIDESGEGRLELARALRAWDKGQRLFSRAGDFDRADPALAEAETRLRELGHHVASWARYQRAGIALFRGRFDEAERRFSSIIEEADRSRHLTLVGQTLWAMAVSASRQGRHEDALLHYREAQELYDAAREEESAGALNYLIGEVLTNLGRRRQAAHWTVRGMEALHPYRASVWMHNSLYQMGQHAGQHDAHHAALALHRESVEISTAMGVPQFLAESNVWRSRSLSRVGDVAGARRALRTAERHMTEMPAGINRDRIGAEIRFTEALLAGVVRPTDALPALTAAIEYFEDRGPTHFLPTLRATKARASLVAGDTARAADLLASAIEYLEASGSTIGTQSLRAGLVESTSQIFDRMVALQLDRNRHKAALEYLERSRRVAWGALGGAGSLTDGDASRLDSGTVIVVYAVLPDRIVAWVLADASVTAQVVSSSPSEVEADTRRLRRLLEGQGAEDELKRVTRSLHRTLLGPIVGELAGARRLVLVPDRFLHTLAFSALVDPRTDRHLIRDFELVLAPSASRYLTVGLRRQPAEDPESALLIGSPAFDRRLFPTLAPLSGAADEVLGISTLYPRATTVAGEAATSTVLRFQMSRHRVLHFAGHAVFNPTRPEESRLLLSPDSHNAAGTVTAAEISDMTAPDLALVVLSACSTLGADEGRVGGLLGLSGSFLQAGAKGVVASLWNVEDEAAAELMTRFHRAYREHGDAVRALRAAQLAMIDSTEPGSAKSWAAFVYTGS